MDALFLVGRFLFGVLFVVGGIAGHLLGYQQLKGYTTAKKAARLIAGAHVRKGEDLGDAGLLGDADLVGDADRFGDADDHLRPPPGPERSTKLRTSQDPRFGEQQLFSRSLELRDLACQLVRAHLEQSNVGARPRLIVGTTLDRRDRPALTSAHGQGDPERQKAESRKREVPVDGGSKVHHFVPLVRLSSVQESHPTGLRHIGL